MNSLSKALANFTVVEDPGSDWAALYENGNRVDQGHVEDVKERFINRLGVLVEYAKFDSQPDTPRHNRPRGSWPEKLEDVVL